MIAPLFVAGLLAAVSDTACWFDPIEFRDMTLTAFDQGPNGWRRLEKAGCDASAANAIRQWRLNHTTSGMLGKVLLFHEGQMRADSDRPAAIGLFEQSKSRNDWQGWNAFVDANIAFVNRDRTGLAKAYDRLLKTPTPTSHEWLDDNGRPIPPLPWALGDPWPPNRRFLETLSRCFGKSYSDILEERCS